jgi:hypothetical protein
MAGKRKREQVDVSVPERYIDQLSWNLIKQFTVKWIQPWRMPDGSIVNFDRRNPRWREDAVNQENEIIFYDALAADMMQQEYDDYEQEEYQQRQYGQRYNPINIEADHLRGGRFNPIQLDSDTE